MSELIKIKVEHIELGHLDLYSKGGKLRRIYIPRTLQSEALAWLKAKKQKSGFIWVCQVKCVSFFRYHKRRCVTSDCWL